MAKRHTYTNTTIPTAASGDDYRLFDPAVQEAELHRTPDLINRHAEASTGTFGGNRKTGTQIINDVRAHINENPVTGDLSFANNELQTSLTRLEFHGQQVANAAASGLKSHLDPNEAKRLARESYKHLTTAKKALVKEHANFLASHEAVIHKLNGFHDFHMGQLEVSNLTAARAGGGFVINNAHTEALVNNLLRVPPASACSNNVFTEAQLATARERLGQHINERQTAAMEAFNKQSEGLRSQLKFIEEKAAKVKEISGHEIPESFLKAGERLESTAVKAGESAAAHSATTTAEKAGESMFQKIHGNKIGRVVSGAASGLLLIDGFRRVFNMGQEPDPNTMTAPANTGGNLVVGVLEAGAGGALLYHNLMHGGKGLGH